jgi:hypothetical protein
VIGFAPSVN